VVRWEKGTVRQSRLADRFLRTLASYPFVAVQGQEAPGGAVGAPAPIDAFAATGDFQALLWWAAPISYASMTTAISVPAVEVASPALCEAA